MFNDLEKHLHESMFMDTKKASVSEWLTLVLDEIQKAQLQPSDCEKLHGLQIAMGVGKLCLQQWREYHE